MVTLTGSGITGFFFSFQSSCSLNSPGTCLSKWSGSVSCLLDRSG